MSPAFVLVNRCCLLVFILPADVNYTVRLRETLSIVRQKGGERWVNINGWRTHLIHSEPKQLVVWDYSFRISHSCFFFNCLLHRDFNNQLLLSGFIIWHFLFSSVFPSSGVYRGKEEETGELLYWVWLEGSVSLYTLFDLRKTMIVSLKPSAPCQFSQLIQCLQLLLFYSRAWRGHPVHDAMDGNVMWAFHLGPDWNIY